MKCKFSQAQLIGYLYNEMDARDQKLFKTHLAQCSDCQKELQTLSETSHILKAWQEESPHLRLVFMNEISRSGRFWSKIKLPGFINSGWALAAIAGVVLFLFIFSWLRNGANLNLNDEDIADMPNRKQFLFSDSDAIEPRISDFQVQTPENNTYGLHATLAKSRDKKILKNINIMANIMDNALEEKYRHYFHTPSKTQGIYLDGLGVVFLLDKDSKKEFLETEARSIFKTISSSQEVETYSNKSRFGEGYHTTESLNGLKTNLIEVVENYSQTLLPISPTESVVIAVNFNKQKGGATTRSSRLVLRIQKKDLDTFNQGKMELNEFLKKINMREY